MITFTKWTIMLLINYLIISLLFIIFPPENKTVYLLDMIIDILMCMPLWTFIHWNIQSDQDLGIKPNIEFI